MHRYALRNDWFVYFWEPGSTTIPSALCLQVLKVKLSAQNCAIPPQATI
jgi:hypothetical protein